MGFGDLIVTLFPFILLAIVGHYAGKSLDDLKQSAIEAGVGEYYINESAQKDWRWIQCDRK